MLTNLTLTRKPGQAIEIGDGILVTVQRVNGARVVVTITADESINIRRTEIKPLLPSDHIESAAVSAAQTCGPRLTSN